MNASLNLDSKTYMSCIDDYRQRHCESCGQLVNARGGLSLWCSKLQALVQRLPVDDDDDDGIVIMWNF